MGMGIEVVGVVLLLALLNGLWVAAWLHWFLDGGLRQFIVATLWSRNWRGGRDRREVLLMAPEEFTIYLAAESQAPMFFRGVLGCPGCLSAHVSGAGALLMLVPSFSTSQLYWLPWVWAGGAWIGHRMDHYLS